MARQDLEYIQTVIQQMANSTALLARRERGMRLREEMYRSIGAGKTSDSYRYLWLKESVGKMLKYAQTLCDEFDAAHDTDATSCYDFVDIVTSAARAAERSLKTATEAAKKSSSEDLTSPEPHGKN